MKAILKKLGRYCCWFVLSYALLWVLGVGILFESIGPIRALVTFSIILAVVFESINVAYFEATKEIGRLQVELEEIKKQLINNN